MLGVQDPQEGGRARCACTHTAAGLCAHANLLLWSQKKPLRSCWQDTAQGNAGAGGAAGWGPHKPPLYRVQMQHVTCRCKNLLTSTPAVHLPRKRSGKACPGSTSAYRAGKLHLFRETLPIKHRLGANSTVMGTGCNAQLPGCDRAAK